MLITICRTNDGENLLMTASMPSIEVGTIGGGTDLGLLGCPRDARHQGCPLHFSQPGCPTPHLHYHYFRHGG